MQKAKLDFTRPIFVIEYNTTIHWSTRYDPAKYKKYADELAARIVEKLPDAQVLHNKVPKKWHDKEIYM